MKNIPKVKYFPAEGFDISQIDPLDITKVYFSGLYERTVTLDDGTVRSYKVYVPSTASYGDDSCYVAVPDGVDTAEFLAESGWIDVAEQEKNAFILFAFEPANKVWCEPETELEYICKAFADMNDKSGSGFRNLVFTSDFNWRWMGYGRGGEMVMRYALEEPMMFASLVVVDSCMGIGQAELDGCADICFVSPAGHKYTEWPNSSIPVPIWLIGAENEGLVSYWRKANECTDKRVELVDGYCYNQDPLSSNIMTFDQKLGQVCVTTGVQSYIDPALTEKIYDFMHAFSRTGMNSPYGNMLYATAEDSRFKRDTVVIDGMEREWYVYVPDICAADEALPLVIYFHGSGQTGLIAMRQGGWWKYGEEKKFITVCPSGSLLVNKQGQIPLIIWRSGMSMENNRPWSCSEDGELENRFVRVMIDKLSEQYNIDRRRIYITGQSNGGQMTQMMCEKGEDIFAAAASTGAPAMVAHTSVPDFVLGGEFDLSPVHIAEGGEIDNEKVRDDFKEALALRGIDYNSAGFFRNGIHNNLEWRDANGVPAYRFCCVSGQAHSWRQNDSHMFWDEWFCRFSRDPENGKILYMGKPVGPD